MTSEPHQHRQRAWLHPVLRRVPGLRGEVGGAHVARSVYGAIVALSLLLVLEEDALGPGRSALALLASLLGVALAEAYADVIAHDVTSQRRLDAGERRETAAVALAVVGAGLPACLVLVAAEVGLFSEHTAFTTATWVTIALLGLFGYSSRRLSGRGRGLALRSAVIAAGIGSAVALFESLLH
ncbi:MAG: hypothetical protein ACRDYU_09170 [Actinomycetes bacterium]